mgnify:FL=1
MWVELSLHTGQTSSRGTTEETHSSVSWIEVDSGLVELQGRRQRRRFEDSFQTHQSGHLDVRLQRDESDGFAQEQRGTYRGAHELNSGDCSRGHDPRTMATLRAVGHDSRFDVSNYTCTIQRGSFPVHR